ncbi:MAG: hypothetical protein M3Y62_02140 [Candidatus Dormibacteraeota bacterium]|nr:hypothetical protein [Candidatus Dormibacteraeota bacterium]
MNLVKTPAILGFLALAACGTSSPPVAPAAHPPTPKATHAPKPTASYDPQQVVDYLHLASGVPGFTGYVYTAPGSGLRCEVALTILTSASMVDGVDGGSFVVATNPDRTAGVVIWSEQKVVCKKLLTEALLGFPPK